jgi:hypothetical protein
MRKAVKRQCEDKLLKGGGRMRTYISPLPLHISFTGSVAPAADSASSSFAYT